MTRKEIEHNDRKVTIKITLILICVFFFFTKLRLLNSKTIALFPPSTNCEEITNVFESNWESNNKNTKVSKKVREEQIKAKFWSYAEIDKNNTMLGHGTGKYQCYCEKYASFESVKNKMDLCRDFMYMSYYGKLLGNFASILVVVFNIASRKTVISLIEKIGLPTMSLFTAGVF